MYQTLQVGTLFRHKPNAFGKLTHGGAPQLILRMNTWNSYGYIIMVTYIYTVRTLVSTMSFTKNKKAPNILSRTPCTHWCCHHYHCSTTVGRLLGIRQGLMEAAELLPEKGGAKSKARFWKKMLSNWESCKIPGWGVFSFQQCGIGSLFNVAWSFLGETARSYLLIEILRAVVFRRILLLFRRLGTEKCECLPQEFVAIGYRKCIIIIIIIIMLSQSLSISILHHWHNIFNP